MSELGTRLRGLGWVTDLWVGGSLATGDYRPGVSDLDLVALVSGSLDEARRATLARVHRDLDSGVASGLNLGCVYVRDDLLGRQDAVHPAWSHGALQRRTLAGIGRVELVRHGYAIFGRSPSAALPAATEDDVRLAARDELTGYWTRAARRPWWWLDRTIAELGLTSMARGRHGLSTGQLLSKTAAIDAAHAPRWLIDVLEARRNGQMVSLPRLSTAWIAWRDARTTTRAARRRPPTDA